MHTNEKFRSNISKAATTLDLDLMKGFMRNIIIEFLTFCAQIPLIITSHKKPENYMLTMVECVACTLFLHYTSQSCNLYWYPGVIPSGGPWGPPRPLPNPLVIWLHLHPSAQSFKLDHSTLRSNIYPNKYNSAELCMELVQVKDPTHMEDISLLIKKYSIYTNRMFYLKKQFFCRFDAISTLTQQNTRNLYNSQHIL